MNVDLVHLLLNLILRIVEYMHVLLKKFRTKMRFDQALSSKFLQLLEQDPEG